MVLWRMRGLVFLSSCPSLSPASGFRAEPKVPRVNCLLIDSLQSFEAAGTKVLLFTFTRDPPSTKKKKRNYISKVKFRMWQIAT